ncbi:hypothetical protein CYMTET_40624 [Cymbomonas tetramitiformis]|uniref:Uncharacterized protein n=1 Tax=Cymbomonas tetramitiformis TaxID=36881 RepID=A0AAE0C8S4_9CHLO|nr:hypothetical protein CYMTET_40624 [Cymbomonas tetramitiformis]
MTAAMASTTPMYASIAGLGSTLRDSSVHVGQELGISMEGLIDEAPVKLGHHPLTTKRDYIKTGHNHLFRITPSIVHFGGYEVGNVHRQTLHICNVSNRSTRLHIIPPNTPFFKIFFDKKGLVAPGMSEEIRLEFCPTEWRYFYDCIRVHSDGENLVVPIHAYPVMNETIFPTRIDFGKCGVNETKTRVVKLECKVPIQFEFEIIPEVPLENSAELWIHPLEGVVPADGGVEITINFKPLRLVTYNFPLQIRLAQFNSKPIVCTVSGSGFPCLLRDTALKSTVKEAQGIDRCGVFSNTTEELEGLDGAPDATLHRAFGAAAGGVMSTKGKKGGGAGGGDAVTRSKKIKKAVTQNPTVRPPATPPSDEVEVAITGGTVKVPTGSLQTHSTVSYVLLQQPGKLRIKARPRPPGRGGGPALPAGARAGLLQK